MKFGDQDYYRTLGNKLLKESCSIDIFVTTSAFVDLCNIGYLSLNTGGEIHYYPHFQPNKDDLKIESDYIQSVSSNIDLSMCMKIRDQQWFGIIGYITKSCWATRSQIMVITKLDQMLSNIGRT